MSDKRSHMSRDFEYPSTSDLLSKKPSRSFSMKSQKPPDVKLRSSLTKAISHFDRAGEDHIKVKYIIEIWKVIEAAWQLPVIGRDLAYEFSDILRREKIVTYIISRLEVEGGTPAIQKDCARLLNQILTTDNRHYIAKNALEVITKYTKLRTDIDLIQINVGILESLFKDSETTSTRLIDLGALDSVLHACRHDDLWTARHCAAALANAAIFGGSINHRRMVDKGTQDWLFPLAFRTDDFCRYYACLAITVLAANPLVEKAVVKSGTLDLVEPFVQSHDPYEFAQVNPSHAQGRSASFLQRMIPLLLSGRPEAQALASFYFAMEASIKAKQQKTQVFMEISAIIPLKRVIATSRSTIARVLAGRCLKIIGEEVPRKLSPQVHLWDIEDVQSWLTVVGFRGFQASFRASAVDGEMLLLLTERELKEDLSMTNNVHRKRFIRDLNRLRAGADYRSVDTSGICDWLRQVDSNFAQYTYRLLQAGVDRPFLHLLTDIHLRDDCGIENGVHRTKILSSVESLGTDSSGGGSQRDLSGVHDVFISYRRNNGSHLASLLKVHLQVRGYRVFLDVESLQEGDFADRTLRSVKSASAGFILVLTAGALDKCAIDHERTDWLHKEIVTAIGNRSNIIPVTTETFQWPLPEDLPKDIAPICFYNGVKWIHEYQDACVDKIDRFLRGQELPANKLSRISSVQGSKNGLAGPPQKRPATHPNRPVRPSGSTDNLVDKDRYPRPRQRASPPGQAFNLPGSVTNRGVAGAHSESARSLDQGDGAAEYDQGSKLQPYSSSNKPASVTKVPDRSASLMMTGGSSSPSSTSSSKVLSPTNKSIKKDIVRLEEVMGGTSERSKESESEDSSEYTSSDESEEEWGSAQNQRGGGDGRSKQEKTVAPGNIPAATKNPAQQTKEVRSNNVVPRMPDSKMPDARVGKQSVVQGSPDNKMKPSTKYKAPPPPSSVSQSRPKLHQNGGTVVSSVGSPEPKPRPNPQRRASSDPEEASESLLQNEKQAPGRPSDFHDTVEKEVSPTALGSNVTKSPPNAPVTKETLASQQQLSKKPTDGLVVKNGGLNPIQKPPRREADGDKPGVQRPQSQLTDGQLSESDFSDNSLGGRDSRQGNSRTNADGNDEASSSDSAGISGPGPDHKPKELLSGHVANANNNNSNNIGVNGTGKPISVDVHPDPDSRSKSTGLQPANKKVGTGTQPHTDSKLSLGGARSTSLSTSPHSAALPDPVAQRRQALAVSSSVVARRDVAPKDGGYTPRRSASERLQVNKPHHPAYPMGGSHFHPSGSQPPPSYHETQQKSSSQHSSKAPSYPGPQHQHYPHGAAPKTRPPPPTHGFDTAV